ncbi:hypothetical protein [Clostridium saccharoperbutylacetonicum]|nr:hypothetical protein [Clostridium saccharoperbutylacetonicum]NSB34774.1 hypothetical protein [Clostridium saccharoperbutylacetonicum]
MTGHAMSVGNQDYCSATCTYWGVQRNLKDVVNWDSVNSASFSNGYSDYCIPIDISTLKPIDADVMDKVLPSSGKVSDLPSNYKTDNYTKDTGSNTGSDSSSFSLPNVLGSIVDLFKALLDAVNSILHFFTIDFSKVSSHMNYGDIMKSHFSPVFDVFNLFSNVHVDSSTTSSDAGKFYMKIPKAMGGDDQEHCVLDLTVGAVYVNKAREIIKYGIWIYFLWYLFRNFSPKFNVGG